MNPPDDQDPLAARLARFLPADLPADFQRRLHAAEPALPTRPRWWGLPALFGGRAGSWPLAYAGVLAVWMLIFALHLATPPAPAAIAYAAAPAPRPAGSPPALLAVGGSSLDRSALLAVNGPFTPTPLQP